MHVYRICWYIFIQLNFIKQLPRGSISFRVNPLARGTGQVKLDPRYNWNIVESGIEHHNPNPEIVASFSRLLLNSSLCLNFFSATCPKSKSKSNKFFHNFHLSKSSFTCPVPRASGLTRKLIEPRGSCLMKFNQTRCAMKRMHMH
jgi:hypothetical protein